MVDSMRFIVLFHRIRNRITGQTIQQNSYASLQAIPVHHDILYRSAHISIVMIHLIGCLIPMRGAWGIEEVTVRGA